MEPILSPLIKDQSKQQTNFYLLDILRFFIYHKYYLL